MNWRDMYTLVKAASLGENRYTRMFGISSKGSRVVRILLLLSVAAAALMMLFFLGINYLQLELIGSYAGVEGLAWFFGSFAAGMITFVFALLGSSSVLYHGKDLPLLMSLPIEPSTLLASRLVIQYKAHVVLHGALLLPAQVVHLWQRGPSLAAIVSIPMQLVLAPVVPVTLSLLLVHLLLRSKRRTGRHGESWAIGVILAVLVVAQGLASRWMQAGMDGSDLRRIAESYASFFTRLESMLVFNRWMTMMALGMHFFKSLLFFLLSIALVVLALVFLMRNSYLLSVSRSWEMDRGSARHPRATHASVGGSSVLASLVRREFTLINTHAAFKMELYMESCIPLVLIVVYAISGTLDEMATYVEMVADLPAFPLIISGVLALMASFSMMSSTSYSREGHLLAASRLLPLQARDFVRAKLVAHMLLFYSSYALFTVVSLVFFRLRLFHVAWMLPLGLTVVTTSACLGLAIDAHQPRLEWTLAQQAVKQNLNGVIAMGLSALQLAVLGGIALLLLGPAGLDATTCGFLLLLPSAVLARVAWISAVRTADELYRPL